MAKINLLPWREELKKQKQKDFLTSIGLGMLLAVSVMFYVHMHINGKIEHQQGRNQFLVKEIKSLDSKIKEIKNLDAKKENMIARMEVIQNLQVSRPQVVHLFEEVALTIPEGVYLESLKQSKNNLSVAGVAQANSRVSEYMRNVDASEWLQSPDLKVITANKKAIKKGDSQRVQDFKLQLRQVNPQAAQTNQSQKNKG
ncbi:MAG TPA: pilus assembly protein PilN [Crenotrichaceae bacterium]|nr:pilus assembly protein PilN [Crenotrichaceae bacterium]